jgi:hypothetical protein
MTRRDRVICLLLPVIDYALFLVTLTGGGSLVSAHVTAFVLASALSCPFVTRDSPASAQHLGGLRLNVQLLRIFVIALSLRVVVLYLFSRSVGWPAASAILPAIFVSHLVLRNGVALFGGSPTREGSER